MSGLLLDTHVLLWYSSDDPALPDKIRDQIVTEPGFVYVSAVSAWEVAIKCGLHKLTLPQPIEALFNLSSRDIEFLEPATAEYVA